MRFHWDFATHPLISCKSNNRISSAFENWRRQSTQRYAELKKARRRIKQVLLKYMNLAIV